MAEAGGFGYACGEMMASLVSSCRAPVLVRAGAGILLGGLVIFLVAQSEWRHGLGAAAASEKFHLGRLVQACWWWGSVAAGVLGFLLAATAGWWARAWPAVSPGLVAAAPRWFWLAVAGLMVAGAAVRAPRLGLSFYNDEAHAFRAHLAGRVAIADLGKPEKFRPATWMTTLYENRSGNNSMPFAIAARTSYDAWLRKTDHARGTVSEAAVRLPVLVCGVLSIGAMAWLAWRLGGAWMGLLAGLLTAFHPWHLRYSVEARSYGILLLALPLLFLALHGALRTGRWRWWLAFGAMEYLVVAIWLGSAHLLVALNLILLAMAVRLAWPRPKPLGAGAALLVPAMVAGVLALGLYLLLNLPHFVQLSRNLDDPLFFKSSHPFPLAWFQDTGGFLAFGTPGLALNPTNPSQPTVAGWLADPFWRFLVLLGVVAWVVGFGCGLWRLFRQGGTGAAMAGASLGGAALTLLYCTAKGVIFLKWYALFLLPGLLLLLAAGLTYGMENRRSWGWRLLLLLPLGACWAAAIPPILTQSREDLRSPVRLARGVDYPASVANPNRTLYAVLWSESPVYDLAATTLSSPQDLDAIIARALAENRPLLVSHGYLNQALADQPSILSRLRDATQFRALPPLPGLDDAATTHFCYQLIR